MMIHLQLISTSHLQNYESIPQWYLVFIPYGLFVILKWKYFANNIFIQKSIRQYHNSHLEMYLTSFWSVCYENNYYHVKSIIILCVNVYFYICMYLYRLQLLFVCNKIKKWLSFVRLFECSNIFDNIKNQFALVTLIMNYSNIYYSKYPNVLYSMYLKTYLGKSDLKNKLVEETNRINSYFN